MDVVEQRLAKESFDKMDYLTRLHQKVHLIEDVAMKAAEEYEDTYRQGGKIMRFSDIFRKYKRIEKQFLYDTIRKREKIEDDLQDLAVYCIVMWIYMDEYGEKEREWVERNGGPKSL
jgi:uncharacterized protein YutD